MVTQFINFSINLSAQSLLNTTIMDFKNDISASPVVTLTAAQFTPARIVANVLWDGGLGIYGIIVNNASALDASLWQFTGWKATDTITLNGTTGGDKIFGSIKADVINGGDSADVLVGMGGIDTLNGGTGDDTFRLVPSQIVAGTVFDGGADSGIGQRDAIELTSTSGTYDLTGVILIGVETILATGSANEAVILTHTQFATLSLFQLGSGTDSVTVQLAAGQTMDLTAKTFTLTGVEAWTITGSGALVFTGAQFNQVKNLAMTASTLTLTSTASHSGLMADSEIVGVTSVRLAATTAGQTVDLGLQSEAFELLGSALDDTLKGGFGNDNLWSMGGADSLVGGAGNDNFWLVSAVSLAGLRIDGGTDNGTLGRDALRLFNGGTYDLTTATLTGIETVRGDFIDPRDDHLRLTLAQFLGLSFINMEGGSDTLDVVMGGASGLVDISGTVFPGLSSVERMSLIVTSPDVTVQMSGAQFNAFTDFSFSAGDVLSLTSAVVPLHILPDAALVGLSKVTLANAAAGLYLDLRNQTEAFDLTGSAANDTLVGGEGNDTILAGLGVDSVYGQGGDDSIVFTSLAQLGAAEFIDGVNDSGAGLRDRIVISGKEAGLGYDFRGANISGIETLLGTVGGIDHAVHLTAPQFAAMSTIDLGAGNDSVAVTFSGAQSLGFGAMTFIGVEERTLVSADAGSVLTLSGTQANGFTAFDLTAGGRLNLTSTSSTINGVTDSALRGSGAQASVLSAQAALAGVAISLVLQTDGFTVIGSALNDTLIGGSGADVITGGAGIDSQTGNGGDDTFALAVGDVATGDVIDGGADTGLGDRDTILLTTAAGVYDLRGLAFSGIETLRAQAGATDESLTLTFAQMATLSRIDLGAGTGDRLAVLASGDLQALALPVIQNIEKAVLTVTEGGVFLTGAQVNRFTDVILMANDVLQLTSTSTGLNALADANFTGINVSAIFATAGVTLDLSRQSEVRSIQGSGQGDLLIGNNVNTTISGGAGSDTIVGGTQVNVLYGGTGDDTFVLGGASQVAVNIIDGGSQVTAAGDRITVTTGANLFNATLTGIEGLSVADVLADSNDSLVMSIGQLGSLPEIDLGQGALDLLQVRVGLASQNVSAQTFATLLGVERRVLVVDGATTTLTLTGLQADVFTAVQINPNGAALKLLSTSVGLNAMSDADFQGGSLTAISGVGATSDLVLDFSLQSEGFALIGGAGNDTIKGSQGRDVITVQANDVLFGNGGADTFSIFGGVVGPFTIDGGASPAGTSDTISLWKLQVDLVGSAITGIEAIQVAVINAFDDNTLSITADQFAAVGAIGLGLGDDRLNVVFQGSGPTLDVRGQSFATRSLVEQVAANLQASVTTLRMSGGQADTFTSWTFSGADQALVLTSTSTGLNARSDAEFQGDAGARITVSAQGAVRGLVISLSNQSESLTLIGSAQDDELTGGSGNDTITGGLGLDQLVGNAGDDSFLLAAGDVPAGEIISGGLDSGLGARDRIVLTTIGGSYDLRSASLSGIETIMGTATASATAETLAISLQQLTGLSRIDLGAGVDQLTVYQSGDSPAANLTTQTLASLTDVDRVALNYNGTLGSLTMTGQQADVFTAMSFGAGAFIHVTSTSTGLNAMSDADFQASGAFALYGNLATTSLLIDLHRQTEGMSLMGGTAADTLIGGEGVDIVSVGTNDDLSGNGGADRFTVTGQPVGAARIDGGSDLAGSVDSIVLYGTTVDLLQATVTGIETITSGNPASDDSLTITLEQMASVGLIDLGPGIDRMTVVFEGFTPTLDVRGQTLASLSGIEEVTMSLEPWADTLLMTGAQADLFTAMAFTRSQQMLSLTSTSVRLNGYSDAALTGLRMIYTTGASAGVTIDISQQSETFLDLGGSANADVLTGSGGQNVITGGGGADVLAGGGGTDSFQLAAGDFATGEQIDGGSGSDTILLLDKGAFDLSLGTITGVEFLVNGAAASAQVQTVTLSLAQFDGLDLISLGGNTGSLVVVTAAGGTDYAAASFAALNLAQEVKLVFAPLVSQVRLTGAQVNLFTALDFDPDGAANAAHALVLTSTSTGLNALSDAAVHGGATVSAAGASGPVTIDLHVQTEAFRLLGSGFADRLMGGAGDDTVAGGVGADILDGGGGDNTLDYQGSNARVVVNLATSTASGGHAAGDVITQFQNVLGTAFADVLTGSSGINRIDGGAGRDVILGGAGADVLSGGLGATDVVSYAGSLLGVDVDLTRVLQIGGDAEGDQITAFESILGSAKADQLTGDSAKNTLNGGGGADLLSGGGGADILLGGSNNDTLDGGSGADELTGEAGADTFVLSILGGDTIVDFTSGSDVMRVSAAAFKGGLAVGALDASQFLASGLGQATDGLQRFVYDTTTGALFFDADGNGAGLQRLIATLSSADPLLASDFLIV